MPGIAFALVATLAAGLGCEKVSHENIDRWENTEKGEDKLRSAVAGDHDPELRAHAAQVLVRLGEGDHVLETLERSGPRQRQAIIGPLIDRLWRDARLEGELARPQAHQVAAKDALFDLRELASASEREQIDEHLISWLTGGYFEGRAKSGRRSGKRIIAAIGPAAGDALVASARDILERPPADDGSRVQVGPELLGSLARSQNRKALNLLLDMIEQPQKDRTLPERAAGALYRAYVEPPATLEAAPGSALQPVLDRLARLAKDAETPAKTADIAIALLAAAGMPDCLPPFVDLVAHEHDNESFRWVAAQKGIRCAGVAGIVPIVEALPASGSYPRAFLDRYLWTEIQALPDRRGAAAAARQLLESDNWIAVVTGVELLGKLRISGRKLEDAERIEKLERARVRLRGWYPETDRKANPTLGQVASRVARRLREVAQPTKNK